MAGSTLPYTLSGAITQQGAGHEQNEDRLVLLDARREAVRRARRGSIYAVADGVSASKAGHHAAELTLETLEGFFTTRRPATEDLLLDVVEAADAQVRMTTESACTLAGVWLGDGVSTVFSIGDSAVLLYRQGTLQRLTPAQVRGGGLAAYIGMGTNVRALAYLDNLPLLRDDIYLICSDGVLGAFETDELTELLRSGYLPEAVARIRNGLQERRVDDDATLVGVQVLGIEANAWQEIAMADA